MDTIARCKIINEVQLSTLEGLRQALLWLMREQPPYSLEDLLEDVEIRITELEDEIN